MQPQIAPLPTSIDPRLPIMRSTEWCPWPLKCMITKRPITGKEIGARCLCMNCTLWYSARA